MTDVWFTSDTHFGHEKIIGYCNRPFASVEEMNEVMVENWNRVVKKGDVVYHLGDFVFTWKTHDSIDALVRRLNGNIHLVFGNHDREPVKRCTRWSWSGDLKRIEVAKQKIVICHYALRVWQGSHRGTWHLYGHSHGTLPELEGYKAFDVGVDLWNFTPISFDAVRAKMATKTFVAVDHHAEDCAS